MQTLFSDRKIRGWRFFCFLCGFLFLISCKNDYCEDSMYAPLVVSFYSEADTSVQVTPQFLAIEGVGSDSYINASGTNSVQLSLKKFDESSSFLFASATDQSKTDTLLFVEKRNNADCPCSNPNGDSVSVYNDNGTTLFLCNQAGSMLIVYKDQPDVLFVKNTNQDTLFAFEPTKDILSVKYSNTQEFVSAECGCLTTFYIDDELQHTHNNISDALITNRSVTSSYNEKHIRIYFQNY